MDRPLVGRSILVVEDEPLIAMDIRREFEAAGARVMLKRSLQSALVAVEEDAPSAAILDHALGNDDSSSLCERLKERDIPFVLHSGCSNLEGACRTALSWTSLITSAARDHGGRTAAQSPNFIRSCAPATVPGDRTGQRPSLTR